MSSRPARSCSPAPGGSCSRTTASGPPTWAKRWPPSRSGHGPITVRADRHRAARPSQAHRGAQRAVTAGDRGGCRLRSLSPVEVPMPAVAARSRVVTRTARPDDLAAVLALVRQHRAEAHAEGVLSGQTPGTAAAAGFRRLLADPGYRVVLAVLPGANASAGAGAGEIPV